MNPILPKLILIAHLLVLVVGASHGQTNGNSTVTEEQYPISTPEGVEYPTSEAMSEAKASDPCGKKWNMICSNSTPCRKKYRISNN